MARPKPLSGFPEFLPRERLIELEVLDTLRETFELHGFSNVETRAVEPLSQLSRKGDITKEVYTVRRLHADEHDKSELGLHFDLTVPLARWVLEHAGHLEFPFRRYQIQKVWRGERPQEGRYREFTQADIDIVGRGELAAHHDIEAPLVMLEALEKLHDRIGLPPVLMHVNNRKLSEGFYRGLGVEDTLSVLQIVDKYDKIGADATVELLGSELGLDTDTARRCVALASIHSLDTGFVDQVRALGVSDPLLDEGLSELVTLIEEANRRVPGRIIADLSIARGLDYYTGAVYETQLVGHESMGSISSGGRYDSLASDGKSTYPGVGISLGVTRLIAPLIAAGEFSVTRSVPTCVVVAVDSEETRETAMDVAAALRARGVSCEVAPKADKYGKQIRYADRRGIPYVWFGGPIGEVKDIRSGDQQPADANIWMPSRDDLRPGVHAAE
ncbi:histidine--tRNA ligase [Propionibacterium freudenreichii]|jgi:histidyl-tRNA synthetase|uniref:histidine--tRNA ligase n=1 Tax=Propionibacterium TaxID=1743 RepID=UPI000541FC1C|nr:histidine--tRNA ligase [Propionibacterium freudenreichii]MDN5961573.1 histidine--tRNA ligase [Propionibacterium sp.]MCT2973963.1 histidine--tRNA ligase [Propionibacterium freudenreichii]MDK9295260.1 histidine--tRNA ligase [Propionibacterium freudenreichii]MDK9330768.1 histidine--tRNA ligase [Propionibacterium freudenreichii]MDK9352538.1 histidine--tRNA ligase [Propionibacterium freudenreichii]